MKDACISRREMLGGVAAFGLAAGPAGSGSSGIGALAQTDASTLDRLVHPEDFGASGDGVTDDAAALQTALRTGARVALKRDGNYAFGSQLVIPSGGGFVGGGLLTMLSGPGKFDQADYDERFSVYAGLRLQSVSDATIEARITLQPNAAIRTCHPVWVQDCSRIQLDMEIFGFKEARFGLVEWNSNAGGQVKLNVHDCIVNSSVLPSMQVTALSVDNNRLDGVNSTGMRFDVTARNLAFGPAAIAAYGYQTDGVNLQGSGYAGHSGTVVAENVHEPFDCFSDNNRVSVVARDCYFGVKLIHGASHNVIYARVDRFMKYALVYGGSSSPVVSSPVAYNRCFVTATGGGAIGSLPNVAAVGTDGPGAIHKPRFNYTEVTAVGDGINMDYIVHEEAGSNNTFVVDGRGFAIAAAKIQPTAGSGRNASTIRYAAAEALQPQ